MNRLVARILLSILLLPTASCVGLICWLYASGRYGWFYRHRAWATIGIIVWLFVGIYWLLLWRDSVRWTPRRVAMTMGYALGSALLGLLAAVIANLMDPYRGDFVGVIVAPLVWAIATTILWRETPAERSERLQSLTKGGVICPACGYNLTGLQGTRCPECGTLYTLDELIAAQPSKMDAEVSD